MHAGLGRLDGIELVVDRAGRAGEVVDLVHLHEEREGDVVAHQLERRIVQQLPHVAPPAGVEIIDAQDVVAGFDQPLAQVRT